MLLPDMTADWKVVRKLADAIFDCVDNAIEHLQQYDDDLAVAVSTDSPEAEAEVERLADRLLALATTGEEPPPPGPPVPPCTPTAEESR